MNKTQLTKKDFVENKKNIFLTMMYSFILAYIYAYLSYLAFNIIIISILIAIVFIIAGVFVAIQWTKSIVKEKRSKEERDHFVC